MAANGPPARIQHRPAAPELPTNRDVRPLGRVSHDVVRLAWDYQQFRETQSRDPIRGRAALKKSGVPAAGCSKLAAVVESISSCRGGPRCWPPPRAPRPRTRLPRIAERASAARRASRLGQPGALPSLVRVRPRRAPAPARRQRRAQPRAASTASTPRGGGAGRSAGGGARGGTPDAHQLRLSVVPRAGARLPHHEGARARGAARAQRAPAGHGDRSQAADDGRDRLARRARVRVRVRAQLPARQAAPDRLSPRALARALRRRATSPPSCTSRGSTLEELFRARPELGESGTCADCPAAISRKACGAITRGGRLPGDGADLVLRRRARRRRLRGLRAILRLRHRRTRPADCHTPPPTGAAVTRE